jgi:hypothetical protein
MAPVIESVSLMLICALLALFVRKGFCNEQLFVYQGTSYLLDLKEGALDRDGEGLMHLPAQRFAPLLKPKQVEDDTN